MKHSGFKNAHHSLVATLFWKLLASKDSPILMLHMVLVGHQILSCHLCQSKILTLSSKLTEFLKALKSSDTSGRSIFTMVLTFAVSRMWMTWSTAQSTGTFLSSAKNMVLAPRFRSFEVHFSEGKLKTKHWLNKWTPISIQNLVYIVFL